MAMAMMKNKKYLSVPSREAGRTGAHGQVHHIRPDTRVLRCATKGATNSRLLLDIVIICYIYSYPKKIAGIKGSTIWVNTHFHKTGWYGCLNLILTEPFWSWFLGVTAAMAAAPLHFAAHFFTRLSTADRQPKSLDLSENGACSIDLP